jgi:hypothetical protein
VIPFAKCVNTKLCKRSQIYKILVLLFSQIAGYLQPACVNTKMVECLVHSVYVSHLYLYCSIILGMQYLWRQTIPLIIRIQQRHWKMQINILEFGIIGAAHECSFETYLTSKLTSTKRIMQQCCERVQFGMLY